jgi:hypothetical protein
MQEINLYSKYSDYYGYVFLSVWYYKKDGTK